MEAYLLDRLTDEQVGELERYLLAHPGEAERCAETVELAAMVREAFREGAEQGSADYAGVRQGLAESGSADDSAVVRALAELAALHDEGLNQPIELEAHRRHQEHTQVHRRVQRKARLILAGSFAALIAVAGLVAVVLGVLGEPEPPTAQAPADPARVVARLTDAQDAEWQVDGAGQGTPLIGEGLYPGQRLVLTAGFAELTTNLGAVATLEAPCTVELLDHDNALRLDAGKLIGQVDDDSAAGFLVSTPSMDITDLGTRFGVAIDPGGQTLAQVFEGVVAVAVRDEAGEVAEPVELTRGQAFAVDRDGERIDEPVADPAVFARLLEKGTDAVKLSGQVRWSDSSPSVIDMQRWPRGKTAELARELRRYTLKRDVVADVHGDGRHNDFSSGHARTKIPAGTVIRSYVLMFNPGHRTMCEGSVRFQGRILGVTTSKERWHGFIQATKDAPGGVYRFAGRIVPELEGGENPGPSDAATIFWYTPVAISGPSDVLTFGSTLEAYYPESSNGTTTTVNGVDFVSSTDLGGGEYGNAGSGTGDASYETILGKRTESGGDPRTRYLGEQDGNGNNNTGGALTPGVNYQIQLWYTDGGGQSGWFQEFGDGLGNTVLVPEGSYVIGEFIADGTEQIVTNRTLKADLANTVNQDRFGAYQIREIPEPSSLALLGLGGLLIARRRRA